MDSKTQEHIKFDKNCLDDILKGVKTQEGTEEKLSIY